MLHDLQRPETHREDREYDRDDVLENRQADSGSAALLV
jgi:hypothetical protein